jgi:hypothetical protein
VASNWSVRWALGLLTLACASDACRAGAIVFASGDTSQPSQTSNYFVGGNQLASASEGVVLSGTAGPWLKTFTNNSGSGFGSGANINMIETLSNTGAVAWGGWHEAITSRTTIVGPNPDAPGFLFRQGSLTVSADRGSGFVTLTQGVDYTISTVTYSGPPDPGNNGHWEAIDITLLPSAAILPNQTLRIQKQIFEVFGDADPWQPGTAAALAQYPLPVPEPATAVVFGFATDILALVRRRRHI